MKRNLLTTLVLIILASCLVQGQSKIAEEFIARLETESPSYHGIPLNSYFLSDLDNDGEYEIIERTNRIESAYVGLLNTELDAAFTYDKIYVLRDDNYVQCDTDIGRHLELQLSHYESWRKNILNPVNLNQDSKSLIEQNRESFLEEIDFIIDQIKEKIE